MVNTEQAFDMLPHVIAIYEKLNLKAVGKAATEQVVKSQPKIAAAELRNAVGEKVIMQVIKESPKVKEDFFNIIAIAAGKTVVEAKALSLAVSVKIFRDVFTDQELWAFFKEAMQ